MHPLLTESLYNSVYFRRSKKFQKNPGRLKDLVEIICSYEPRCVLDVGCGIGFIVNELRNRGVEAYGVDFAKSLLDEYWQDSPYFFLCDAKYLPFVDETFDVVFSSDFFEHILEGDIDQVVSEMKRVGGRVLTRIAYGNDLDRDQELYHITNKPKEWWVEKLKGVEII